MKLLNNLISKGKLTPMLKDACNDLLKALGKNDYNEVDRISYLHQKISGDINDAEYGEDDDYNKKY